MHRMLRVDNLSWKISTYDSFFIILNLEKDFLPEQLVAIKLRNKGPRGWISFEPLI